MGILKTKSLINSDLNYLNKNILSNFNTQIPIIVYKNITILELLMIF